MNMNQTPKNRPVTWAEIAALKPGECLVTGKYLNRRIRRQRWRPFNNRSLTRGRIMYRATEYKQLQPVKAPNTDVIKHLFNSWKRHKIQTLCKAS